MLSPEELEQVKADFRVWVFVVWQHLGLPEPTAVQYDIANFLSNGPRRRMVSAFRGVGKSWLTVSYALWRLLKNPQEKILVVSASEKLSTDFCTFAKRLIDEMEDLQHLRPRGNQRDSVLAFDVGPATAAKDPSVRACGITGQLTGGRATLIVADDIEVVKNSLTEGMREKLSNLVSEFDALLMPGGEVIYLGTPQSANTVYSKIEERGYTLKVWPVRFPSPSEMLKYRGRLAPFVSTRVSVDASLIGSSIEPTRFTETDLMEREASFGRSGFGLQFLLDTTLSDANRYPLKLNDLIVTSISLEKNPVQMTWANDPRLVVLEQDLPNVGLTGDRYHLPFYQSADFAPFDGCCMFVDPSGRGKDETAYAIVAMLRGMLYVLAVGGLRDGYSDATLITLAEEAKKFKVKHLRVEDNFGGGMFMQLLAPHMKRIYPVTMEDYHSVGQKELRIIDTLEPVMNQHRLVVDRAHVLTDSKLEEAKYQLFYQLTHITRERNSLRHDDKLEALSGCVGYWVEQMNVDVRKTESANRSKLMDVELKEFMKTVSGRPGKRANWTRAAGR